MEMAGKNFPYQCYSVLVPRLIQLMLTGKCNYIHPSRAVTSLEVGHLGVGMVSAHLKGSRGEY